MKSNTAISSISSRTTNLFEVILVILLALLCSAVVVVYAADERPGGAGGGAAGVASQPIHIDTKTHTHHHIPVTPTTTPRWVNTCGHLAPMASIALYMAPLPTILKICRAKSGGVGDLPLLPYTSMMSNCFVWAIYGALKQEPKLVSSQSVGCLLGMYYVARFIPHYRASAGHHHHHHHHDHADDEEAVGKGEGEVATKSSASNAATTTIRRHLQGSFVICGATAAMALMLPLSTSIQYIGVLSVIMNLFLFGSPLVALRTVIETKSAASIPLPYSIATTVTCTLWAIYSLIAMDDITVYLPSFIGLTFGLIQILLKIVYSERCQRPAGQPRGVEKQRQIPLDSKSESSVQMRERLIPSHTHANEAKLSRARPGLQG